MAGSVIGIKIADGSFFPILDRSHRGKKKLVLTPVNEQQQSVHIDLFQGENGSMEGAEYIGSLVVSNIQPTAEGEAEINLVLGIDADGNLNATASDAASGEYESLSVSLESHAEDSFASVDFELSEESRNEAEQLNDFDFDFDEDFGEEPERETTEASFESGEQSTAPSEAEAGRESQQEEAPIAFSRPADGRPPTPRKGSTLLFLGFMILSLAALALLGFFVFRLLRGPELPPLEAQLHAAKHALLPFAILYIRRGAQHHQNGRTP